jgi:hypothetical protein
VIRTFALRQCGYALCIHLLCIGAASSAVSEDSDIPKGVGPLPEFAKGARAGAVVTADHIQSYRAILPKEVADLVQQGEFAFEAVKSPHEPLRFATVAGSQAADTQVAVNGELQGLPANSLPSPIFPLGDGVSADSKQFAYKALWNAAAVMWRSPAFALTLSAYIFPKADLAPHKLEFELKRIHPRELGGAPGALPPVFRETISATKPVAIQSLSWLTLRFFGAGEDFIWVASPVNRRIRQMTSSNRSDPLFTGVFTPDDLLVWSGKVELVEPTSAAQLPLLVPFFEGKEGAPTKQDSCTLRSFESESGVALNHQSKRFASAAGWVATNTIMALRNAWRIEFSSRDPFSNESRTVLYIDRDSGLPVYRIVWDSAGRLRKVSIGIIRSLETGEGEKNQFIAGQMIVFPNEDRRLVLVSDRLRDCQQYSPGLTLKDFDPQTFVTFEPRPEPQKRVEEPDKSEDSSD